MNKIIIVATIIAKEGKAELVRAELDKLIEPTRAEEGNVSYKIHQDLQNINKFVVIEEWKDEKAIKEHMATTHIKAYGIATNDNDAIESFEYVMLDEI